MSILLPFWILFCFSQFNELRKFTAIISQLSFCHYLKILSTCGHHRVLSTCAFHTSSSFLSIAHVCCVLSHFTHVWLFETLDCSLPGSSAHGILQARILELVAKPSSRASPRCRDWTRITYVSCRSLITSANWEALYSMLSSKCS